MNRSILKILLSSIFLLCVNPFPSPVQGQTPTSTPVPLDENTKALLEKANTLYYDYHRLGLHKFQCQIKLGLLENLKQSILAEKGKDDSRLKAIQNLKFNLTYDEKTGFHFSYSGFQSSGNVKVDENIVKIIDGSQKMILGYCQTWKGLAFEPAFNTARSNFVVTKTATGYVVDESRDNTHSLQTMTDQLLITEVKIHQTSGKDVVDILLKPSFLTTPQGLLINSLDTDLNQGFTKEKIDTEYSVIDHFEMPKNVKVQIQMASSDKEPTDIHLNFEFFDIHVN